MAEEKQEVRTAPPSLLEEAGGYQGLIGRRICLDIGNIGVMVKGFLTNAWGKETIVMDLLNREGEQGPIRGYEFQPGKTFPTSEEDVYHVERAADYVLRTTDGPQYTAMNDELKAMERQWERT